MPTLLALESQTFANSNSVNGITEITLHSSTCSLLVYRHNSAKSLKQLQTNRGYVSACDIHLDRRRWVTGKRKAAVVTQFVLLPENGMALTK